jgi:lipopolysaccharide transport system ATP-binding protein
MQIQLTDVTKEFPITGGKKVAVDKIDLEINLGERIGIIGRNGAGKTTLLQIIAGLAKQTSGKVSVEGHVNCIMTLGVGLKEDLTGRENIYIDGELNGKTHKEIDQVIDEIIAFADIGEFIDYPVRTYSTGMKSRLAFAMIIFIEPGILIIDEALSTGDAQFSAKASKKMKEICAKGKILILVSHSMAIIANMCQRVIWMDKGKIMMDGDASTVTHAYLSFIRQIEEKEMQTRFQKLIGNTSLDPNFSIDNLEFLDRLNTVRHIFDSKDELTMRITVKTSVCLEKPDLKISIERTDGNILMENRASHDGYPLSPIEGKAIFEIPMGRNLFGQELYKVNVELLNRDQTEESAVLASYDNVLKIIKSPDIIDNPAYFSTVEWKFEQLGKRETH